MSTEAPQFQKNPEQPIAANTDESRPQVTQFDAKNPTINPDTGREWQIGDMAEFTSQNEAGETKKTYGTWLGENHIVQHTTPEGKGLYYEKSDVNKEHGKTIAQRVEEARKLQKIRAEEVRAERISAAEEAVASAHDDSDTLGSSGNQDEDVLDTVDSSSSENKDTFSDTDKDAADAEEDTTEQETTPFDDDTEEDDSESNSDDAEGEREGSTDETPAPDDENEETREPMQDDANRKLLEDLLEQQKLTNQLLAEQSRVPVQPQRPSGEPPTSYIVPLGHMGRQVDASSARFAKSLQAEGHDPGRALDGYQTTYEHGNGTAPEVIKARQDKVNAKAQTPDGQEKLRVARMEALLGQAIAIAEKHRGLSVGILRHGFADYVADDKNYDYETEPFANVTDQELQSIVAAFVETEMIRKRSKKLRVAERLGLRTFHRPTDLQGDPEPEYRLAPEIHLGSDKSDVTDNHSPEKPYFRNGKLKGGHRGRSVASNRLNRAAVVKRLRESIESQEA